MEVQGELLNLDDRLRRSLGRSGRVIGVTVKVTQDERGELEAVAKQESQALGEWAREVLLREARRGKNEQHKDAMVTELVAVRMLMVALLKPLLLGQKVSIETISEIMAVVRREKHNTAREVMEQYTVAQPQGDR